MTILSTFRAIFFCIFSFSGNYDWYLLLLKHPPVPHPKNLQKMKGIFIILSWSHNSFSSTPTLQLSHKLFWKERGVTLFHIIIFSLSTWKEVVSAPKTPSKTIVTEVSSNWLSNPAAICWHSWIHSLLHLSITFNPLKCSVYFLPPTHSCHSAFADASSPCPPLCFLPFLSLAFCSSDSADSFKVTGWFWNRPALRSLNVS